MEKHLQKLLSLSTSSEEQDQSQLPCMALSPDKDLETAWVNPIDEVSPFLCLLLSLLKGRGSMSSDTNCASSCTSLDKLYLLTSCSSIAASANLIPV